jgi:hypothetical protein
MLYLTQEDKLYLETELETFLNKSLFSSDIVLRDTESNFEPSLEEQAIRYMIESLHNRISYY